MLLLLAACYYCIIPVAMVIVYRGVFILGIAVIGVIPGGSNAIVSANAIGDYSYINARESSFGVQIVRCVTGLGPSDSNDNNDIGSFYFNGTSIPFGHCGPSTSIVQPRGAGNLDTSVGIINIGQCRDFSTTAEGIYTCTMTNSSMVDQSVRFGVYFTGRSE